VNFKRRLWAPLSFLRPGSEGACDLVDGVIIARAAGMYRLIAEGGATLCF